MATTDDSAPDETRVTSVGRIEGLDAWRASLMLLGVLLHATQMKGANPLFDVITFASTVFRMGAFFAISGFLAATSLARRSAGPWRNLRMIQIGTPTLFGLLVVCPLTMTIYQAAPRGLLYRMPVLLDWYHIWFLVALLLYTPMVAALHQIDQRHGLFARLDAAPLRAGPIQLAAMLMLPIISLEIMSIVLTCVEWAPASYWAPLTQVRLILGYAPFYLLGFAIARSWRVRDALLRERTMAPLILLIVAGAYLGLRFGFAGLDMGQRDAMLALLMHVGSALCPPAAAILILRSAFAIPRVPPFVRRLAAAALTIYIVHFPIVTAANVAFAYVDWPVMLEYAVSVALGAGLAYAIHVRIVEPWPLAALLLNGRTTAFSSPTRGIARVG